MGMLASNRVLCWTFGLCCISIRGQGPIIASVPEPTGAPPSTLAGQSDLVHSITNIQTYKSTVLPFFFIFYTIMRYLNIIYIIKVYKLFD